MNVQTTIATFTVDVATEVFNTIISLINGNCNDLVNNTHLITTDVTGHNHRSEDKNNVVNASTKVAYRWSWVTMS